MAKIIRPRYSVELSIGVLLLIFLLSFFLSPQIFNVSWRELIEGTPMYVPMFLASIAVIIMVLILWEDFLFPIKVKPIEGEVVFRNHRTKLKTQLLIYLLIPIIFIYVYIAYKVSLVRFIIWASLCITAPVAGKLKSGIKNYNDFLKLTDDTIEYKNNEKEGILPVKDIQHIILIKDVGKVIHKVQVVMNTQQQIIIDLDEMELEAYYETIDKFINAHFRKLLKDQ